MKKQSVIGKEHVLKVSQALKESLVGQSIQDFPDTIIKTVQFIQQQYSDIASVVNKYETAQPDQSPDLQLQLSDQQAVTINLFTIKGSSAIQPKNLGAKSFLKKYFCSKGLQIYFNDYLEKEHKRFFRELIALKEPLNDYDQTPLLRRKVRALYPRFTDAINSFREAFLLNLREYCFELLKDEYNLGAKGIQHAFDQLMMLEHTTIITRYGNENKCLSVERWKSTINSEQGVKIYKKGNNTIGIRSGKEALTLRFKFESSPSSSIKIATSYEFFPEDKKVIHDNIRSVARFEQVISNHVQGKTRGKGNAIGKCNEAMIYYRFLKETPTIYQTDEQEYQKMLNLYAPEISNKVLLDLKQASAITVQKVEAYLKEKYDYYELESIQLVGQSYLENRLDTSDLQLVLLVDQKYLIESLSLKAIAKRNTKITAKNPGAKRILGPTYFDIGSLALVIDETERKFKEYRLNHRQSLERVSKELGKVLGNATQNKIQRGVKALLGNKPTVVTIYAENDSLVLEYDAIQDDVKVYPNTPSTIQTTLRWNSGQEELSLRLKFSKGQQHGWSALKLSCDYSIKYP